MGCRYQATDRQILRPPGMLTPLSYALYLHELLRRSDMVGASCATGGLGTVLIDSTGEAVGFSAEGLVMKILQTHFPNALPVAVSGNSPQQPVRGTPFVDIPLVPHRKPHLSAGCCRGPLQRSQDPHPLRGQPHRREVRSLRRRLSGVKLRGPGKLWQIAPPSVNSANEAGKKPAVEIVETPQTALPDTVQVPPISVSVYEFEIENV